MRRRDFIELGAAMAAVWAGSSSAQSSASRRDALPPERDAGSPGPVVDFIADGRPLGPAEYAQLLMRLADEGKIAPDFYSNGGIVEELEHRFARWLGHESAVFMPTGTLANHIAVRRLAEQRRRVIVPAESHLYRDSGDCAQTLSSLNLIPLGANRVCYGVDELRDALADAEDGRVATPVGALLVESPVRRMYDRIVRDADLVSITSEARRRGIRTHLDGARIFIQSAHTRTAPADYGRLFDTVYTSLWKCFNAPAGAVLAGPKDLTQGLFHERRMFGGSLAAAWPFAAVALHYVEGFIDEYRAALRRARALFATLSERGGVRVEEFESGTHLVRVTVEGVDPASFRMELRSRGVRIPEPHRNTFLWKINPTLSDAPGDLEQRVVDALEAARI